MFRENEITSNQLISNFKVPFSQLSAWKHSFFYLIQSLTPWEVQKATRYEELWKGIIRVWQFY